MKKANLKKARKEEKGKHVTWRRVFDNDDEENMQRESHRTRKRTNSTVCEGRAYRTENKPTKRKWYWSRKWVWISAGQRGSRTRYTRVASRKVWPLYYRDWSYSHTGISNVYSLTLLICGHIFIPLRLRFSKIFLDGRPSWERPSAHTLLTPPRPCPATCYVLWRTRVS